MTELLPTPVSLKSNTFKGLDIDLSNDQFSLHDTIYQYALTSVEILEKESCICGVRGADWLGDAMRLREGD
jgi:hypothetical protein